MSKGGKRFILGIITIVICIVILIAVGVEHNQVKKSFETLNGRILYLQDTLSILQSDISNMKDEIRTTLEEENSLLESHTFELVDMNFENNTYSLNMTVIPKDYTDSTEISVFFGTLEFELEARDFFFNGTAVLPFDNSFAGNVTVLIKNGSSKNTEVLHSYDGYVNDFGAMVKATALNNPTLKDGVLTAKGPARVELDGKKRFDFVGCNLWIEVNGEKVCGRDYLKYREEQSGNTTIQDYAEDGDGLEVVLHTALTEFTCADGSTIKCKASKNDVIHIYVEAVTEDGYVFQYDIFTGTVNDAGTDYVEGSVSLESNSRMIDRYGNIKNFTK